jgi:hypothetical protein
MIAGIAALVATGTAEATKASLRQGTQNAQLFDFRHVQAADARILLAALPPTTTLAVRGPRP